jgi:hypothetical protein
MMRTFALLGMTLLAGTAAAQVSTYTDLRGCPVVAGQGTDIVTRACEGPGGWGLRLESDPDRERLTVLRPDRRAMPLPLDTLVQAGPASNVGPLVEWRGPAGGRPSALIVRYGYPDQADGTVWHSDLVVASLADGVCVLGRIGRDPRQNERARALADRAGQAPCLPPPVGSLPFDRR